MNAQPTPLPTLREELDRKVVDQLHQLVTGFINGKINSDAYSSGVKTLWEATAGLVSNDISAMISAAQDPNPRANFKDFSLFRRDGEFAVLVSASDGQVTLLVGKIKAEKQSSLGDEVLPGKLAREKAKQIRQLLLTAGFVRADR